MAGAELISFKLGREWIGRLWGVLWKRRENYYKELEEINKIIYGDPLEIARYYVEPDCQEMNPADRHEEDHLVSKEPIMRKIDQFFRSRNFSQEGCNQLFILSDAGMGKTALLTMLKLMHLTAFWPSSTGCILKKLGPTTLADIEAIENRRETILLLDSLDEDAEAFGRVQQRLIDVLNTTRHFKKVIITCRTQFFPKVEGDPFQRPGLVTIGGYTCPAKYLSFFGDQKVRQYIEKRFPKKLGLFSDKKKMGLAENVICKMGSLRCRPMLLSYIEDLMGSPKLSESDNEYEVYNALVQSWLNRETNKMPHLNGEALLKACVILATYMQARNKRAVTEEDLNGLIERMEEVLPIKEIDMKGRSLINRNSEGHYRFSHYSIQEFCVAKLLLEDAFYNPKKKIPLTALMLGWIVKSGRKPNYIEWLDFKSLNLSGMDLRGIQLPGADLSGLDLRGTDFRGANLQDANLQGTDLIFAQFEFHASIKGKLDMVFSYIPSGDYMMGSPENEPGRSDHESMHEVGLTKGFYMQITHVTQRQYQSLMGKNPSKFKGSGPEAPVENVSWEDAQNFIKKLNELEGDHAYRLPTEAEWEYACRAGTDTPFFFGRCLSTDEANYDGNNPLAGCPKGQYRQKTTPVKSFSPNAWGLYDMHGNVWEWCNDWYGADYYKTSPKEDPQGPDTGDDRVLRGGSWSFNAVYCRSAHRGRRGPASRYGSVGFRLLRSLP